jgi:hypothetical protein
VQKSFERGVALLHSFWYEEARKQFEEAERPEVRHGKGLSDLDDRTVALTGIGHSSGGAESCGPR